MDLLDLCNNERELAEGAGVQAPEECRYRVALVPRQPEPVAEFMDGNPSLIGRALLHVCLKHLGDTGIFSHTFPGSCIFPRALHFFLPVQSRAASNGWIADMASHDSLHISLSVIPEK